jgi:phosphoribosyl 1,2-cyclic phosphodiesterase
LKVCVLGSGSRGNCIYVESNGSSILVDQGFAHRRINERMTARGLDPSRIGAILVTHEHHDHMLGVGITARKLGIPIYATAATIEQGRRKMGRVETIMPIESGTPFTVGPFEILPFAVSHDAADPVQYRIAAGKSTVAVATDLGFVSTLVTQCLADADLVILEANHDVGMLRAGSYPWPLKQRIMGRTGHLSNVNAADLAFNLGTDRHGPRVVLAHLSAENNDAEIAERTIRELFERYDRPIRQLVVASQDEATAVIEV